MTAFRLSLFFLALASLPVGATAPAGTVQFNRDIRPILSENCFYCHGPDSATREAGLRLDIREDAIKGGAVTPGDVKKSTLIERIWQHDPDELMPPPKSNRHLTEADRETLKRWIEQGAVYEAHWSFVPVKPVALPPSSAGHPIDHLVAEGLKAKGWEGRPEASRETLIRRLSFDLTGLPPAPAEVESFAKDADPLAYERLVDRLLGSRHYGERMAVDWLDMARYADSYGFQVDREREVWPWRDWVIRAFNENLPFDRFVTWQLAGDLLPEATDEQILATAFNRLHQQESEGGSVEEEYRVEYVADRVQTFATAFLGLTLECARCHDHKYDPITHKDYYSLFAFFQNIDEAGLYSFFTASPPTPALVLADPPAKAALAVQARQVEEEERKLRELRISRRPEFEAWLKSVTQPLAIPGEVARYSFDVLRDGRMPDGVRPDRAAVVKGANVLVQGREGQGMRFTGDDAVDLPLGNFKRHEPFSISLWMKTPDVKDRAVIFHRSRAWTDAASRGYELLLEEGRLKWSLIHFWPGNAISIRARDIVPPNEWVHVTVTSDGSSRASGLALYVNGRPAAVEVVKDALTKEITGGGGDNISLAERFRDRGFKGGEMDEFRVFDRALTPLEALLLPGAGGAATPLSVGRDAWLDYYLAVVDEAGRRQLAGVTEARARLGALQDAAREIMVMRELPVPKKAYVLFRGDYTQRREEVTSATPAVLPPFPAGEPRNRLGLARWLTRPDHPLFARVTVNRLWQSLLGRGLVKTTEDFGSQGERPVYPELLDWLAGRFMASGWDVKGLLKTIVMSRTYRQDSIAPAEIMADDPDNQWLARGPRFRLPAEMIRDNALTVSGLLANTLGGPPVNPYEMQEAFKPVTPAPGQGLYRRSLYTTWRRTSPPPAMIAFDAPRRAVCSARRERTDSPLQALILLNGTQYVEAARALGEKLYLQAKGDVVSMIDELFLTCLSRPPDDRERAICRQLYQEQWAAYQAAPEDAGALLKTGNSPRNAALSVPEAAAATVLAQALLNHDLSVVKR